MVNTTNSVPILRFSDFHEKLKNGFISDFGYFYYGKSAPKHSLSENATTPCVRYGELYSKFNEIVDKIYSYTLIEHEKLKFSKGGEVLVPRVGEDPLGFANCSFLPQKNIAIGEMISVYNTNENGLFITYYFNAKLKEKFARVVEGGNVSNLYFRYLENIDINVPEIKEQNKIVEFLSSVDKKIQLLEKKKEQLELYKKGVMQKIFSREIRFKDDNGNSYPDWEKIKLGEVIEQKSIRNKDNSVELVLSVSNKKGFISQQDQFDGYQVASKNVTNYKLVSKGEYAYNPSRINVGSIARLDDFERGIVSPMYVIFKLRNNLNPIFFDALYSSHRFKYLIKIGCSGSVRDSLNFNEMEKFDIELPSIEEQKKIADFLSFIDKKINTTSAQIDKTKEFKKGLLQQMFV